ASHGKVLSTILTVAATAAIGALIQILVMHPLRHASALVRVIATLGILTVVQHVAVQAWGSNTEFGTGLLPQTVVKISDTINVSAEQLWIAAIAVVLTGVL